MLKEIMIKGGLTVAALLVAEAWLERLEKESLKRDKETQREVESEDRRYEDIENILRESEGQ